MVQGLKINKGSQHIQSIKEKEIYEVETATETCAGMFITFTY